MSEHLWWILGGALAGVLARIGRWRKPDDTVDWWQAAADCASIPALSALVAGGVNYFAPDIAYPVMAALSTLAAIVGVAGIEAVVLRFLNRKADTL